MLYRGKIYSRFSRNSEANASEFMENHGEIFPHFRMNIAMHHEQMTVYILSQQSPVL